MNVFDKIREGGINNYDRLWIKKKEQEEYKKIESPQYSVLKDRFPLTAEQKNSIDEYYTTYLGRRIPYDWHQFYAAHNGVFIPEYFPELLYVPHFEHYMNEKKSYGVVLEDKNFLSHIARAGNVNMPGVILTRTMNLLQNAYGEIIDFSEAARLLKRHERVFCKPTTTGYGGKGCFIYDFSQQKDGDAEGFLRSLGSDFVIQELVKCHRSIASLYPKAVNTFRVTTYRWKGKMYSMPLAMRLGRGDLVVDNASSGGLFIGVKDDGVLSEEAFSIPGDRYAAHPDTGIIFKGHSIYGIKMVLDAAYRLHSLVPQLGVIGWDFTVGEDGSPVLIEANVHKASYRLSMMAHGVSPFLDRTAEVLQWVGRMSRMPKTMREHFLFGETD